MNHKNVYRKMSTSHGEHKISYYTIKEFKKLKVPEKKLELKTLGAIEEDELCKMKKNDLDEWATKNKKFFTPKPKIPLLEKRAMKKSHNDAISRKGCLVRSLAETISNILICFSDEILRKRHEETRELRMKYNIGEMEDFFTKEKILTWSHPFT